MTDKYPLGFNINMAATRDWNWLIEACKLLNSSHQMAMISPSNNPRNDIDSVMRLHAAIGDSSLQWFIRVYSPNEGDWKKFNVDAYVNYCAEIHRHFPNVIFDAPANEPGVPDNEVEAFIDNQVSLIEKFAAKGIRYAACCYGMGSPHHEHVTGGRYDKLLRALAKYDTAYLSEHHYAMGWLEAGSGYSYDILLDPAKLPQYWRTKWAVQEGHYLIRRSDYWAMRADKLGIRRPRVFLSECPFDQNPDGVTQLNNRHNGVWDKVRNQYGLQKYNYDLRGLNTYEKYWKAAYPNLTYEGALAKLLIHYVEDCMYVDYIVAGFMFAWNQHWDIPMGTDISIPERKPTIRLLSEHAKTYVKSGTIPPPDPTPVPTPTPPVLVSKRIRATVDGLRIRANAALSSTVIGLLPRDWITAQISLELDDNDVDVYSWRLIEVTLNNSLIRGYVANELLDIEPSPDEMVLSPIERELVTAYRANDIAELLAIIDNDNVVQLLDSERELLAAFDDREWHKILDYIKAILPEIGT